MYPTQVLVVKVLFLVVGFLALVFGFVTGYKTFAKTLRWYLLALFILEIVVQVIYGKAIALATDLNTLKLQGVLMQAEAGKMLMLILFWGVMQFLGALFSPRQ